MTNSGKCMLSLFRKNFSHQILSKSLFLNEKFDYFLVSFAASNAVKNIPVAENALVWCRRNCCLTQSRESLLTGDGNYYTTLTDTTNAYTVVESSEQIPMDKMTPGTSADGNSNNVVVENNSIENNSIENQT